MAENVVTAVLQNERQEIQTLVQQMRVWFLFKTRSSNSQGWKS